MSSKIIPQGIFGSGMVLQRDRTTRVWGVCSGGTMEAYLDGVSCPVSREGEGFTVTLPPQPASFGRTLELVCGGERLVMEDVCFGDVFLLSGQSNMQLEVNRVQDVSEKETLEADYPLVRHFTVEPRYFFGRKAEDIVPAQWIKGIYPQVMTMSAAGFFFGRRMYEENKVPVGLVLNAMGGSTVEAWMSEELLCSMGISTECIKKFYDHELFISTVAAEELANTRWHEALTNGKEAREAAAIPEDCGEYTVPGMNFGTGLENYTGSLWFYRTVELDAEPQGDSVLYLGDIIDSNRTYVNGQFVGEINYRYPPSKYTVPAGVLHKGENLIACRMIIKDRFGGFVPHHHYYLEVNGQRMDISGTWLYKKQTAAAEAAPPVLFPPLLHTGLFNASLHPLKGLEFTGMLWYQGESNAGDPAGYSEKFTAMMKEWRTHLGQRLPVVCTELCDYIDPLDLNMDTAGWKEIQRQQREQPRHTPDCATALAADLGEPLELHPQRKQELGERLAAAMLGLLASGSEG